MTGTLEIDICASGNRSTAMTGLLRAPGFDAWSVTSGTNAWACSGRPLVHSAAGYRASVAVSMLDATRPTIVVVDDTLDNAEKVGLHVVGAKA